MSAKFDFLWWKLPLGCWLWMPLMIFVGALALIASGLLQPADRTIKSAMVGKPVPELALPGLLLDRPGLSTADLKGGRPRLVNVFASWCIPCLAEAPQLMALKRAGAEIDAVAVRDTPDAVTAFLHDNGDPYARIGDDKQSRAMLALGSSGVPETFVVDSSGTIVEQHIGDVRADDVPKLLAALRGAK